MVDMAWGKVLSPFDVVLAARKNGTPTAMKRYPAGWEGAMPRSHLDTGIARGCVEAVETPPRRSRAKAAETPAEPAEQPAETPDEAE
jgi:hypothetical protein